MFFLLCGGSIVRHLKVDALKKKKKVGSVTETEKTGGRKRRALLAELEH